MYIITNDKTNPLFFVHFAKKRAKSARGAEKSEGNGHGQDEASHQSTENVIPSPR